MGGTSLNIVPLLPIRLNISQQLKQVMYLKPFRWLYSFIDSIVFSFFVCGPNKECLFSVLQIGLFLAL
ncbi:hypothetical protein J5N97_012522 [Dioscorea zingiberensis]|uniref:Uncharacterized protein n=1 Tax=Dioscorea zingiberensis TaxID=325984 RepID=A0A9D5CRT4_9LILI|nr:hypothetical protein J5N97_012522 [Dioscorea zingiberensis]